MSRLLTDDQAARLKSALEVLNAVTVELAADGLHVSIDRAAYDIDDASYGAGRFCARVARNERFDVRGLLE